MRGDICLDRFLTLGSQIRTLGTSASASVEQLPHLHFPCWPGFIPISESFRLRGARPSFRLLFSMGISHRRSEHEHSESLNGVRLTVIDSGFWKEALCLSLLAIDMSIKEKGKCFYGCSIRFFGTGGRRFATICTCPSALLTSRNICPPAGIFILDRWRKSGFPMPPSPPR